MCCSGRSLPTAMAELDPKTLTWTDVSSFGKVDRIRRGRPYPAAGRIGVDGQHELILPLRNGTSPIPMRRKSRWEDAGSTPAKLPATDINAVKNIIYDNGMRVYHPPGEIGPAILRPDGTVFETGANCNVNGPSTDPSACVIYQPHRPHRGLQPDDQFLDGRPGPPRPRGRGRYLCQPAAGRECLFPNQYSHPDSTIRLLAPTLVTRASATARCVPSPPKPRATAPQQSPCPAGFIYKFYEFDGTKLIPEP